MSVLPPPSFLFTSGSDAIEKALARIMCHGSYGKFHNFHKYNPVGVLLGIDPQVQVLTTCCSPTGVAQFFASNPSIRSWTFCTGCCSNPRLTWRT